ncbi:hypothetical protein CVT24_003728 [Panaeolus cyanescens]|uniref:Uncharacterized protein n=1 Tax=Panaeolus cyanescens TaxID=181874 RepID=A0A409W8D0_9AGAR|nr:hypothetical protein CVT24_003728 [Panaeolus cyanescens]
MHSPSAQKSLPESFTDPTTRRILEAKKKMLDGESLGIYLGGRTMISIKEMVMWHRIGSANVLVTKESVRAVQEYREAQEAANSTPPENAANSEFSTDPASIEPPTLEPAILSIITTIDHDKCFVLPCNGWKGPSVGAQEFKDIKMTFQGKSPTNDVIVQDFKDALNNLKALVKEVSAGDAPMRGFLMSGTNGAPVLRFRHVVFEEVTNRPEDGSDTASDNDDSEWTLDNWPVAHPAAAEVKRSMHGKYRPNPLPAYNTKGEIIAPERCKTALPGATVRINFTLTHWLITSNKTDGKTNSSSGSGPYHIFNADIDSIRVLSDPPAQVITPRKRRTTRYDPDDVSGSPSPKKKKY